MRLGIYFIFSNMLLGVGLAMDAFSVSLANGLHESCMKKRKLIAIAFVFAAFQAIMPLIGWFCVHTIADKFFSFRPFIPWIAMILLFYIGFGMLREGLSGVEDSEKCPQTLSLTTLMIQGIATSIDALSVGFTIAEYNFLMAISAALIISVVTFIICICGVVIGKHCGTKLSGKSSLLGGAILILIGLRIFIEGIF